MMTQQQLEDYLFRLGPDYYQAYNDAMHKQYMSGVKEGINKMSILTDNNHE